MACNIFQGMRKVTANLAAGLPSTPLHQDRSRLQPNSSENIRIHWAKTICASSTGITYGATEASLSEPAGASTTLMILRGDLTSGGFGKDG